MSITTTENMTAVTSGESRALVDLLVDAAAVVGRIGEENVAGVSVGHGMVCVDLAEGENAWQAAWQFELHGDCNFSKTLSVEPGIVERVAFGQPSGIGRIEMLQLRSPGTAQDYTEAGQTHGMAARDRAHEVAHRGRRPGGIFLGSTGVIPGWETD